MATDNINKLLQLKELYEKGVITREELEAEKAKLLGHETIVRTPVSEVQLKDSPAPTGKGKDIKSFINENLITIILVPLLLVVLIAIGAIVIREHRLSKGSKQSEESIVVKEVIPIKEELPPLPDYVIPYNNVKQKPTFNGGGVNEFSRWLSSHLTYPESAREANIEGKVQVSFIVNADGRVIDVKVSKSVDPALDNAAVRVIKTSPRWDPGKQNGEPVAVQMSIPVIFHLR